MLNLRNTNIVTGLILGVLGWFYFRQGLSLWWLLPLGGAYSLVLFYGSYVVSSNFYIKVTCALSAPAGKIMAISFDDGPASEHTAEILDILKEQGVEAAFFCIGQRVAGRENLLQKAHADGHVIGNHSYSHHLWFDLFSTAKMRADLDQADEAIQSAIGLRPRLFRPPYGVTNPNLARAIRRGGYTPIGWSIRSLDTVTKDENKLLERVTGAFHPGAILLFHDTCKSTLDVLPEVIGIARAQGYVFVRPDKMLNVEPYA